MTAAAIQLLLLDGQGVVFNNPFPAFLRALAAHTNQPEGVVWNRWYEQLRRPFWTGQMTERELWERLTEGLGETTDWRPLLESSYDYGPAAGHLEHWSRLVPVWLLSNHRGAWLRPRLERFGLAQYFERILVSDEVGEIKPDPAAFEPVLSAADPAMTLFVDDQRRNVRAAERAGLSGVHADKEHDWVRAVDQALGGQGLPSL